MLFDIWLQIWRVGAILLLGAFGLGLRSCELTPQALRVCPAGCPFTKIQDALEQARERDMIQVEPGTYEGPFEIKKSINIQGAGVDRTILTLPSQSIEWVIQIQPEVRSVTLTGVKLTSGKSVSDGLKAGGSTSLVIKDSAFSQFGACRTAQWPDASRGVCQHVSA